MITPANPINEDERLEVLHLHNLLDTLPEQDFDDITRLATEITGTPMSTITLVDKDRQWFKSERGFGVNESTREHGFCAHAILQPDQPMIVHDARLDERFHDNPFVIEDPHLIFYAGVPVTSEEGYAMGTLCVLDQRPRKLTEGQLISLQSLANQVGRLFELRRNLLRLKADKQKLKTTNEQLTKFSYILSHDIKSPLNSVGMLLDVMREDHGHKLGAEGNEQIEMMEECVENLKTRVASVVQFFRSTTQVNLDKTDVHLDDMLSNFFLHLVEPLGAKMIWPDELPSIKTYKVPLEHILSNLISNAIKYNDKELPIIRIDFQEKPGYFHFEVADNGPGIPAAYQKKVFQMFETLGQADRFNKMGTGLGLPIVKKFIDDTGGKIELYSAPDEGCTFKFSIKK